MKNLCGECDVCCIVPRIDKAEVFWKDCDKEAGQICEKLTKHGCSVYEDRPASCKNYECLWLQLSKKLKDFSVEWRPDNLKIVVSTFNNPDLGKFIFTIKELEEGSLDFNNLDLVTGKFLDIIFDLSIKQVVGGVVVVQKFGSNKGHALKQNSGG